MYMAHLQENHSDKNFDISKRYKCLVCVKSLDCLKKLEDLACTGELVTHYLSSKRFDTSNLCGFAFVA